VVRFGVVPVVAVLVLVVAWRDRRNPIPAEALT
jgi:hypothetical protein